MKWVFREVIFPCLNLPQALSAAPDLDNYKARWPLTDMIKMRLKATSRKATISKQAAQVAEAERAAKEILAGMETVVNEKKAKKSKSKKLKSMWFDVAPLIIWKYIGYWMQAYTFDSHITACYRLRFYLYIAFRTSMLLEDGPYFWQKRTPWQIYRAISASSKQRNEITHWTTRKSDRTVSLSLILTYDSWFFDATRMTSMSPRKGSISMSSAPSLRWSRQLLIGSMQCLLKNTLK